MRSLEAAAVPFKIQYRYRPQEYGDQLVRMYLLTNNKESKLGTSPLPDGIVRVFRENGRDGLSYLAQQSVKYIPIGDKIELNLGADPEVIFELIKLKTFRDEIWLQRNGTNVFLKLGDGDVEGRAEVCRSSAGTITRSLRSAFATTRPSRSTWKSAVPSTAMSCSGACWSRRCTIIGPFNSARRSPPARRPI